LNNGPESIGTRVVEESFASLGELDMTVFTWHPTQGFFSTSYAFLFVGSDGLEFQTYDSDFNPGVDVTYASWWAFKASSDFDTLFGGMVETSRFGDDTSAFFHDLDQNNGAGLFATGSLSALASYDAVQPVALTANIPAGEQISSVTFYRGSASGF